MIQKKNINKTNETWKKERSSYTNPMKPSDWKYDWQRKVFG